MRRFAIFAAALFLLVAVSAQPWGANAQKRSICVCLPSRAGLLLKSMTMSAATRTHASGARLTKALVTE
jgi:hypothetical protein